MIQEHRCPVCETKMELDDGAKIGERITCPGCYAQLSLHRFKGKKILACALCKEPVFDPVNCGDCERLRDKQKLLDEGRL